MKAMVCEMCGSNDVIKTEGMYVCQHCGTKYDVEEARKLMVEISGAVNVEGVATADNLMDRAQEFFDKDDMGKASEYVTRVLDIDARNERARTMQRAIEDVKAQREEALRPKPPKYHFGDVPVSEEKYQEVIEELRQGKKIAAIKLIREVTNWDLKKTKEYTEDELMVSLGLDPHPQQTNSGGCYVATAVYGSYDCPEVWTLRRFRDYRLAQTYGGRFFIKTYYAISPMIVKLFGNTKMFVKLFKPSLDALVSRCKMNGLEDTPYKDKVW